MKQSRAEVTRRRRARRRLKLIAANVVLLACILGVGVWSVLSSDKEAGGSSHTEPARTAGEAVAPVTPPESGEPVSNPPPPEEEEKDTVRLAFVGDILLGEYVGTLLKQNGYDYPYQHVQSILQAADVTAANLESAVTTQKEKPGKKTYEFQSAPEALPAMRAAGFDLVNLANNHTLDFGADGLRDTIKHLGANDIAHVGAGENADEAYAPVYIEKNGIRIAFLGFTRVIPFVEWKAGKNQLGLAEAYDYTRPVKAIKEAKENADLVVVLAHWGEERELEPEPDKQVSLGRRFVDAGADLVIGSHPHVLQGYEYYKDRWIAYSLGNFIFTKSKETLTYDSGILEAECVRGGKCSLQLTPFRADTPQPRPMEPQQREQVLNRLSSLSIGAAVNEQGEIIPLESD